MSFKPSEIGVPPGIWKYHGEAGMIYFPPGRASYPTRKLCKYLAVAMLRDPDFLGIGEPGINVDHVAYSLEENLGDILTYNQLTNLLDDLYEWALKNGLPDEIKIPGQAELAELYLYSLDPETTKLVGGLGTV